MTDAYDGLLNLIKTQTLCSSNQIGLRLFKIKLDRYLDLFEKTEIIENPDDIIIRAIVNYACSEAVLRAYKLFKDERLFEVALGIVPFSIYLPEDRWHPENFMVKASDKEIVPGLLEDLAVKNEDETEWLLTKLCPNLNPASTFTIKKPMVFYVSKDPHDPNYLREQDLDINELKLNSHPENEVKRVIIVVDDKITPSTIEKLVKLRMTKNVMVRILLCLSVQTGNSPSKNLHIEFLEWFSSKLQIPLIKFDLSSLSVGATDRMIKTVLEQIVSHDPNTRFDNELVWSYGLQDASTSKIIFSDVRVIYQKDLEKKPSKKRFDFLNNRNIPFLSSRTPNCVNK